MGFFKKIFKGVKKVFKKIGKGIKSAFKSIGKFMGRIGIVGQLAIGFMMPGIGQLLGNTIGSGFTRLTGALAKGGKIAQTAGKVLQAGAKFAKAGHSAFKTVTEGVSNFIGEFTKTALKKIPGMDKMFPKLSGAPDTFFKGENSAWKSVQSGIETNIDAIGKAFGEGMDNIKGIKNIYTADQARLGADALARTGQGTIPGSKGSIGQESLLSDPKSKFNIPEKDPFAFDGEIGKKYQAQLDIIDKPLQPSTPKIEGMEDMSFGKSNIDVGKINIERPETPKTFFEKFKDRGMEAIRSVPDKILEAPGKYVENLGENIEQGLQTKTMQAIGLEDKPVYNYTTYGTYVPEFQTASIQDYGSPQINDRAMQMAIDPQAFLMQNPYGYGANIYQQQMQVRAGGTV